MRTETFDRCLSENPTSRRSVAIMTIACVAVVFDGYDLQVLAYSLPKLVDEWDISSTRAGLLATYTFIGLFAGAVLLGAAGDRWGRKRMLVVGVTVFAVFTGTAGFVDGYEQFAVLRFCAALGMGGVLPGAITMVTDYTPAARRGRITALCGGCFTFGFVVAAVASRLVVPNHGWRPLFLVSYSALLLAVVIAVVIPETPQYLAARGRLSEAAATARTVFPAMRRPLERVTPAEFFADAEGKAVARAVGLRALWTPRYRRTTILVSALYLCVQFAVYAMSFWMVTLLVRRGLSLASSYGYAIEQAAAATAGGFVIGWFLDRMDRRLVLAAAFAAGGVSLTLFGFTTSVAALYVLNALAGALVIGGQNTVHSLVMDAYGVEARGTALGWALGIGRVGGLLGPLVGGFLLDLDMPFPLYFVVFAVPALLAALTTLALRSTRGRAPVEGAPTDGAVSART
ncbi:MFS transporter, AAHS family, benzoate transport protein [Streptomyces zhaozhouensis]|uniref:MFS transporter, AAHS family, benzoate transport protein n=1 Tax=Streptomyces zhaozhouensis TaxID=1300267 RepID=A0A286DP16_9ACTN|nr:MFS transporter [Streptomyces zhaozhouensis]SOD60379.1 MFS transporter, AAHS family, benzoate transport protein [Streptomyces zhaozhouensis]